MPSRHPTVLVRQPLPQMLPCDMELLQDEPRFSPDEVEAALKTIRQARRRTHPTDDRTSWYIAIQRAEKFLNDCFEAGHPSSHQTKAAHMAIAFEAWAHLYPRAGDIQAIHDAFNTVLEWRGGYRITRGKSTVYFGIALNDSITNRINQLHRKQDMVESRDSLSRTILASFD